MDTSSPTVTNASPEPVTLMERFPKSEHNAWLINVVSRDSSPPSGASTGSVPGGTGGSSTRKTSPRTFTRSRSVADMVGSRQRKVSGSYNSWRDDKFLPSCRANPRRISPVTAKSSRSGTPEFAGKVSDPLRHSYGEETVGRSDDGVVKSHRRNRSDSGVDVQTMVQENAFRNRECESELSQQKVTLLRDGGTDFQDMTGSGWYATETSSHKESQFLHSSVSNRGKTKRQRHSSESEVRHNPVSSGLNEGMYNVLSSRSRHRPEHRSLETLPQRNSTYDFTGFIPGCFGAPAVDSGSGDWGLALRTASRTDSMERLNVVDRKRSGSSGDVEEDDLNVSWSSSGWRESSVRTGSRCSSETEDDVFMKSNNATWVPKQDGPENSKPDSLDYFTKFQAIQQEESVQPQYSHKEKHNRSPCPDSGLLGQDHCHEGSAGGFSSPSKDTQQDPSAEEETETAHNSNPNTSDIYKTDLETETLCSPRSRDEAVRRQSEDQPVYEPVRSPSILLPHLQRTLLAVRQHIKSKKSADPSKIPVRVKQISPRRASLQHRRASADGGNDLTPNIPSKTPYSPRTGSKESHSNIGSHNSSSASWQKAAEAKSEGFGGDRRRRSKDLVSTAVMLQEFKSAGGSCKSNTSVSSSSVLTNIYNKSLSVNKGSRKGQQTEVTGKDPEENVSGVKSLAEPCETTDRFAFCVDTDSLSTRECWSDQDSVPSPTGGSSCDQTKTASSEDNRRARKGKRLAACADKKEELVSRSRSADASQRTQNTETTPGNDRESSPRGSTVTSPRNRSGDTSPRKSKRQAASRVEFLLSNNLFKKHLSNHIDAVEQNILQQKKFGLRKSFSNFDLSLKDTENLRFAFESSLKLQDSETNEEEQQEMSTCKDESPYMTEQMETAVTEDSRDTTSISAHSPKNDRRKSIACDDPSLSKLTDMVRNKSPLSMFSASRRNRMHIPSFQEFRKRQKDDLGLSHHPGTCSGTGCLECEGCESGAVPTHGRPLHTITEDDAVDCRPHTNTNTSLSRVGLTESFASAESGSGDTKQMPNSRLRSKPTKTAFRRDKVDGIRARKTENSFANKQGDAFGGEVPEGDEKRDGVNEGKRGNKPHKPSGQGQCQNSHTTHDQTLPEGLTLPEGFPPHIPHATSAISPDVSAPSPLQLLAQAPGQGGSVDSEMNSSTSLCLGDKLHQAMDDDAVDSEGDTKRATSSSSDGTIKDDVCGSSDDVVVSEEEQRGAEGSDRGAGRTRGQRVHDPPHNSVNAAVDTEGWLKSLALQPDNGVECRELYFTSEVRQRQRQTAGDSVLSKEVITKGKKRVKTRRDRQPEVLVLRSSSDVTQMSTDGPEAQRKRRLRKERPYKSDPMARYHQPTVTCLAPDLWRRPFSFRNTFTAKVRDSLPVMRRDNDFDILSTQTSTHGLEGYAHFDPSEDCGESAPYLDDDNNNACSNSDSFRKRGGPSVMTFLHTVDDNLRGQCRASSFPSLEELTEETDSQGDDSECESETRYRKRLSTFSTTSSDSGVMGQDSLSPEPPSPGFQLNHYAIFQPPDSAMSCFHCNPTHLDFSEVDAAGLCEKCILRQQERKETIYEIIETELNYGRDLRILKEEFYVPMQTTGLLSAEQLETVFVNLEELIAINAQLTDKLRAALHKAAGARDEPVLQGDTVCETSGLLITELGITWHIPAGSWCRPSPSRLPAARARGFSADCHVLHVPWARLVVQEYLGHMKKPRASLTQATETMESITAGGLGSRPHDAPSQPSRACQKSNTEEEKVVLLKLSYFNGASARSRKQNELSTVNIGNLFIESSTMFLAFENYCVNQAQASLCLEQLEKERELLRIFLQVSQTENGLLRRMHLKSFLMVPVQRIMKYPLLLNRLYKATPNLHPDKDNIRQAREKIEDILGHINAKAKPNGSLRIKRKQSELRRYSLTEKIEVNRVALEVLGWSKKEVSDLITSRMYYAQPADHTWAAKRCRNVKFTTVHAVLLTLGQQSRHDNSNDGDRLIPVSCHTQQAAVVLVKEKNGKYQAVRDPFYLEKCVVSVDPDFDEVFELQEWGREAYIFKAEDPRETRVWVQHLRQQTHNLGQWRRRRNALPNIMLKNI
ncbi:hypothetical protein BaRGS_00001153 [Batillaria attramentaria]|uniref:DH domain-containing protein n=1 Tax=Batillaria attramentaria TaxID=370345 RepID=A0ABD0M636_9CAEN